MGFGYDFSQLRKVVEQTPFISEVLGELSGQSIKTSPPSTCQEQSQEVLDSLPS
ncbi:hypothetical protein bas27_0141 [Escherichia phage TrudiGerster]|uniref:Uncharacterized protein n=1 Tax=Escherichia phage TrudiGerster TaxID=2851991 RepID=A0AAE7W1R9_9CAUD|nr:hypothetical protein bas27_0141 [Escherichia phage TrudiGerster]